MCKDIICVCMHNFVALKVSCHASVVIFPIAHDRGCEIKIIVIVNVLKTVIRVLLPSNQRFCNSIVLIISMLELSKVRRYIFD